MSRTLRTLLTKLKQRKRSRSSPSQTDDGVQEDSHGQQDPVIAEQLADLTISSLAEDPVCHEAPKCSSYRFGSLEDFEFTFTFMVTTSKAWPGPPYDEQSLFAPGVFHKARPTKPKSKHKCSKRKLSQEGNHIMIRAKERPTSARSVKEVPRSKTSPRPPQYYGSPPSREPPLHLLNLPGEIRNNIYRILCVRDEPIIAQYRPIAEPKRSHAKQIKPAETTRRFPREPTLALTCRQLQQEVLSTFYAENKFIFRQNEDAKFKDLSMTSPGMIGKWSPGFGLADSLTHLELHLKIRLFFGVYESIIYTLRKLADGRLSVSNNADGESYCACFDKSIIDVMRPVFEVDRAGDNLIKRAMKVMLMRTAMLRKDEGMMANANGSRFAPVMLKCAMCGLECLRALESGM